MQATYHERKLTELLLYVAERLTTDVSGAAKIDKVLYFADFAHGFRQQRNAVCR